MDLSPNLKETTKKIRRRVLTMLYNAQTCHLGSDMSIVELLTVLYFSTLKEEDRFILSKGHGAATLYAVLCEKGFFKEEELRSYGKPDTKFLNLANSEVPGVLFSTGALGHGLPVAVGIALAKKLSDDKGRVFTLLSDGEMQIGTTWESALFASHHKLDNLTVIVDSNKLQACGNTKDILDIEPLKKKFTAFGWDVKTCNGHNIEQIKNVLKFSMGHKNKPSIIIANTIKGKGVSFAEKDNSWHYNNLDNAHYQQAMKENE